MPKNVNQTTKIKLSGIALCKALHKRTYRVTKNQRCYCFSEYAANNYCCIPKRKLEKQPYLTTYRGNKVVVAHQGGAGLQSCNSGFQNDPALAAEVIPLGHTNSGFALAMSILIPPVLPVWSQYKKLSETGGRKIGSAAASRQPKSVLNSDGFCVGARVLLNEYFVTL